jgi:hypothetical protein
MSVRRKSPEPVVVQRSARVVRRRTVVGAAEDRYEREADAIAERIVHRAVSNPIWAAATPTRIRARTDQPPPERVGRSTVVGAAGGELDGDTERSLRAARSRGVPMDPESQQRFGGAFGTDLSGVRIHIDSRADTLNRSMGSLAFASGQHIFFRRGEYRGDTEGRRLLAHELTHVLQQQGTPGGPGSSARSRIQRKVPKSAHPGDLDEFNRIENRPAGTPHKDQGIASQPVNFHAPLFNVVLKPGKQRFTAKVVLTRKANIGDSEATYLAPGQYDSGFLWASDKLYEGYAVSNRMLTPNQAGPNDTEPVIFSITAAVAKQSKAAEQEHLEDYRYAYRLSLQAAQDAITAVAKRRFKHVNGMQAAAIARAALQREVTARSNGHLTTLDPTDWENEYRVLFRRSGIRDTNSWHIQDMTENTTIANPSWNGVPCRVVDVAPGPTFNLGVSSQQQIDPGPVLPMPVVAGDQDQQDQDEES